MTRQPPHEPRHRADTATTRNRQHHPADHTPWWRATVVPGVGSQPNADAAQPRPPTDYDESTREN